jgi:hypothetical protein
VELPYGLVSSESVGGAGGTCVIRGCVPKKLLVYACAAARRRARRRPHTMRARPPPHQLASPYALPLPRSSEFSEAFQDAQGFGWGAASPPHNQAELLQKKARGRCRCSAPRADGRRMPPLAAHPHAAMRPAGQGDRPPERRLHKHPQGRRRRVHRCASPPGCAPAPTPCSLPSFACRPLHALLVCAAFAPRLVRSFFLSHHTLVFSCAAAQRVAAWFWTLTPWRCAPPTARCAPCGRATSWWRRGGTR